MLDKFHIETCPVCKNSEFKLHLNAKDWLVTKEPFSIYDCTSCSFTFTQDAPSLESIGRYYDDVNYVEHSDSDSGLIFKVYHQARKLMLKLKLNLIKKTTTGKKLLDVGSGSGYFLSYMKEHGYDGSGVEMSEKARDLCEQKFNIKTYSPDVLVENSLESKYDLITMWHVFEHVYTYDEYFKTFDSILEDSGKLMIAMPNYHCYEANFYKEYWNGYDVPRHLWHFDEKTFTRFAKQHGFKVRSVHRLPLDPFYNSMVSAEYKYNSILAVLPLTVGIGFVSYLQGLFNKSKASSLVYLLERNN